MGSLIHTFTFDRNTIKRTAEESADSVAQHIAKVEKGEELNKGASNIVGALTSYMGIFAKADGKLIPTKLAAVFLKLSLATRPILGAGSLRVHCGGSLFPTAQNVK